MAAVEDFLTCWQPLFFLLLLDAWDARQVIPHTNSFLGLALLNSMMNLAIDMHP